LEGFEPIATQPPVEIMYEVLNRGIPEVDDLAIGFCPMSPPDLSVPISIAAALAGKLSTPKGLIRAFSFSAQRFAIVLCRSSVDFRRLTHNIDQIEIRLEVLQRAKAQHGPLPRTVQAA
jgi:hypothetical protein